MKTRLLIFFSLFSFYTSRAQYVTIPDTAFVNWLNINGYSACMSGNQMDTTCILIVNSYNLTIKKSNAIDLNGLQYFRNIIDLQIDSCNQLIHIPNLTAPLTGLRVWNCKRLNHIPPLPTTLIDLSLVRDSIALLPSLPTSLETLDVIQNPLTSLPQLPSSLLFLRVDYGSLTTLSQLPNSLIDLSVSNNNISVIPPLPASLQTLNVSYNPLSQNPVLPNGLIAFQCWSCNLTSCPQLPASLQELDFAYNNISVLPDMPSSLYNLTIYGTNITTLPHLPQKMSGLRCSSIPLLSTLTNLPDTITNVCDLTDNPNLTCLPKIGYVNLLQLTNTDISCLPNYGTVLNSQPSLNSLPICDLFNNNSCNVLWNIAGRGYSDTDNNCLRASTEPGIYNIKHRVFHGGVLMAETYSGGDGYYSFNTPGNGIYEVSVDTTGIPLYVICPTNNVYFDTLTNIDSLFDTNDFALECKVGFDIAAHSIVTPELFRPANNTHVNINAGDASNFYNAHCASGIAGTVTVTINGPASYIAPANGALTPSNVSGNIITWNIADFGTINALNDFNIVVHTDTFAQIGQQVCFTISVTPTTGDNNPANNTLTHCFTIVNSYDPNDKQVSPVADIDTAQEWLTYTVRFQNTGTAEAQHIYIMDTLDTDVDEASFRLLAYSHQLNVQIKESVVRFNFPNINLPDSNTNEPASHGYIQYKVKLKEGLPIGTAIENTAFIYFDFNPPVVTNTTTNTIALPQDTTGVGIKAVASDISLSIYPNPAHTNLTIATNHSGNTVAVYNAQGSLVIKQTMAGTAETLNIAELAGGVYYVEVSSTQGTARRKFIKL